MPSKNENEDKVKPLSPCADQHGSQMGRTPTPRAEKLSEDEIELVVARPIIPDPYAEAYDAADAYWGLGPQVWQVNLHTTDKHYVYYARLGMLADKKLAKKYPDTEVDVWSDTYGYNHHQAKRAINECRRLF